MVSIDDMTDPSFKRDPLEGPTGEEIEEINAALDQMVHAKSIAVVGATRSLVDGFSGMFANVSSFDFPGKLYPINP